MPFTPAMPSRLPELRESSDCARTPITRRGFIAGAAALVVAGVGSRSRVLAEGAPTLHLFLHTLRTAHSLEKAFGDALPQVSVKAFSRAKDFTDSLEARPDAVLALAPVLDGQRFDLALQGMRGGKASEAYVLLSTGPLAPSAVRTIGAIDLLGRARMPEFIKAMTGGPTPDVTGVTKLLDLLPLLQFGKVEAIALPEANVALLRERTRMELVTTALPSGQVGLPAVSLLTPRGQQMKALLQGLDRKVLTEIGVETWR